MQPWTPSPDEPPRDPWDQPAPTPGGHRRDQDEYDQPTGLMRRPPAAAGEYAQPEPRGYGQGAERRPQPGVYGRAAVSPELPADYGTPAGYEGHQPADYRGQSPAFGTPPPTHTDPSPTFGTPPPTFDAHPPAARSEQAAGYGRAAAPSPVDDYSLPAGYTQPDPKVYGRPHPEAGSTPPSDERTWASASLGLAPREQLRVPPPPRRRREWDEQAWQETRGRDEWAAPRRRDEWLEAPRAGGRGADAPRLGGQRVLEAPADLGDRGSGEQPQLEPGARGRRTEVRSRSDRSRHEREYSSRRTGRIAVFAAVGCVLLLLAGLGYWFFGPQGDGVDEGAFIPGVTVTDLMAKVEADGFSCLAPGATVARCTKPVSGVEFSVTLQFTDPDRVTAIVANGGTGVHSEVKVTDDELRPFFAMASTLPFAAPSDEAASWVDDNLRQDGKTQFGGVVFETAEGQDVVSMYTRRPA